MVAMINLQNRLISKISMKILHVLFHLCEILQQEKIMYVEQKPEQYLSLEDEDRKI